MSSFAPDLGWTPKRFDSGMSFLLSSSAPAQLLPQVMVSLLLILHVSAIPQPFQLSGNPLLDQPNLSFHRPSKPATSKLSDTVRGFRQAVRFSKTERIKQNFCRTEPLTQVLREDGCRRKVILNRFCYGQCSSFYVPRATRDADPGNAFASCASCAPKKTSVVSVTLQCPGRKGAKSVKRRVLKVRECRCVGFRPPIDVQDPTRRKKHNKGKGFRH